MKQLQRIVSAGVLGIVVSLLSGCAKEAFTPDPHDPRLPMYTEGGNQVGGALINNVSWKTSLNSVEGNKAFYFTDCPTGDSLTVHLNGIFNEGSHKNAPVNFTVVIKNTSLDTYQDLEELESTELVLDGTQNYVILKDYEWFFETGVYYYYGGTGKLVIKNVKTVEDITLSYADGVAHHPCIVSGTFEFSFPQGNIKVESGRFDFRIDAGYWDKGERSDVQCLYTRPYKRMM